MRAVSKMNANLVVFFFLLFAIVSLLGGALLYRAYFHREIDTRTQIRNMAKDAIFVGLIAVMTFVPNLGYLSIFSGVITFTLLHLPVLLGASLMGWKRGALYGFLFGLLCWIRALMAATSAFDILFQNPAIAIIPRLLFGLAAGLVYEAIYRIKKKGVGKTMLVVSSLLLTMLHTVLVFGCIYLFTADTVDWLWQWLFGDGVNAIGMTALAVTALGALGEAVLAALFVPSLNLVLSKAIPNGWPNLVMRNRKLGKDKERENA